MISDSENKKEFHETDKLYKKLIAPSLGSFRLDFHVHQHYGPLKIDPMLLPYKSANSHGTLQTSKAPCNITHGMRVPTATEITLDQSFPKIGAQASGSNVDFAESFVHYAASGVRVPQQRVETSLSSPSSTTKMKQLPLPQVQSSDVLQSSTPSSRGKKNVSVCSDRYLGTSRVGQQLHRRSRSATGVLHPMSSNASSSDQVRRFEEERTALLKTRSLKRSTEVMAHRKDRKYHMCGSGVPLFNRYMVDSEEMDRLRQLTQARSAKRGSSPVSSYGRYGGTVTSGHGTWQTKLSSESIQKEKHTQGNNTNTSQITIETNENENNIAMTTPVPTNKKSDQLDAEGNTVIDGETHAKDESEQVGGHDPTDDPQKTETENADNREMAEEERTPLDGEDKDDDISGDEETDETGQETGSDSAQKNEIENMMPNVRISRTQKKKNGKDAFLTELNNPEAADEDVVDMFSNFKWDSSSKEAFEQVETTTGMTSQEPSPMTAEEALMKMLINDDKIAAMEQGLMKINLLKGGMEKVGHLEESELNLDDFKTGDDDVDYNEDVFGKVRSDEELKDIERRRAKKREERRAKAAKKVKDSIVMEAKVSPAKSRMAEIYNFISSQQQEVFEKKFAELDIDGNGVITLQELFKRMYKGKDRETGRAFMQVFDLNNDKTIDQREFLIMAALNDKLLGKLTESLDTPLELDLDMLAQNITAYKELFEVTDQDADGRLTLEDIMLIIALSGNLDSGIDPEVVQHVYNTIDTDDNGTIDFMEFLTYIPFFLKLHNKMVKSRHITIAEVERSREAVKKAVLKVKSNRNVTMTSF